MRQYLDLLEKIIANGYIRPASRPGLPPTAELFGETMRFDLSEGFPILTCRKMPVKAWMVELCWLLKGKTTIAYLLDRNVHIWDDDAYRFYKFRGGKLPKEEWLEKAKITVYDEETRMIYGDLGKVYGYQWRCFNGIWDQIQNLQASLHSSPDSRRHIVTAWNPLDYNTPGAAALPACHAWFQCNIRANYLDLMLYQRSCDMILGVPFDIVEYALLTHLLAKSQGLEPGIFTWIGASCHIYTPHLDVAKKLISRKNNLYELPILNIAKYHYDITDYEPEDFELIDYNANPAVKAELFTGV